MGFGIRVFAGGLTPARNLMLIGVAFSALVHTGSAWAQDNTPEKPQLLPQLNVTWSRLGTGIVGASTSIITAEEIERSPAQTLPDILSREPGIQITNLFGGVNAARSVVDMRGFGATATSNTLFLINGRRITDLDIVGVDLAAIPRQSIERIEITRGNSGVVLYGDGAVGGVINIVTKTGVSAPLYRRIDGAFGSFNQREGNVSFVGSNGPWSLAAFGNHIASDGYRDNNDYIQRNGTADIRYTVDQASFYFNVAADDQHLGLPGARRVDPVAGLNQLVTSPQAARTPYDWASRDGYNLTSGMTWTFLPGAELIVDGGVRHKRELAQFFQSTATTPSNLPLSGVDTTLTTASFTPRLNLN